jgi:hypothetical protein
MKSIQKIALSAALISVLVSCQPTDNTKQILSKPETKKEIMETIANDGDMSKDMIVSMMNSILN